MAGQSGDTLDDREQTTPRYSPICTYCKHWLPGDGYHCAGAYPRGGPTIPMPIWDGRVTHVFPYPAPPAKPSDHGVHFDPHPNATKLPAKIRADLAKRAAMNAKQK
jgi:hypothetical protein